MFNTSTMTTESGDTNIIVEAHMKDGVQHEEQFVHTKWENDRSLAMENGFHYSNQWNHDSHNQLLEMVVQLNFQNEYLKSQFDGLKDLDMFSGFSDRQMSTMVRDGGQNEDMTGLLEKIESLNGELSEERQTRVAAEEALKHLRAQCSEADSRAQEFSAKLAEVQEKMDQEIRVRDEKYSELDSKFNRLHKRAKQRIQEVQKEKDDLEAQFRDVSEKADQASSQLSALQQELERTRQQANDALKAMDVERQQLRSANNKLRDNIEELRHSLEPKENTIESLQLSLLEKEQMLEDMRGLLKLADEKKEASIAELSSRHQKQIESLECQLADELSDRNKATETISSLQELVAEKEFRIAEMDAAASGEVARLRAAMEAIKGQLTQSKNEHEKAKENLEAASQSLKTKLKTAESNCIHAEIEVAKMRSQLELDLSVQTQLLNTKDAELSAARAEISRLESEFASYKVRAHTLLQKKDADLSAARNNEQLKAHEDALKEAEKELLRISAGRDNALQELKDALASHDKEINSRDAALSFAQQQIKSIEVKLNSTLSCHQSEKEAWEVNLKNIEDTWRIRCDAMMAQNKLSSSEHIQEELEDLKLRYGKLKEEHDSFRDLADKIIEEKDKEISRLVDDNKNHHQSPEFRKAADDNDNNDTTLQKQDIATLNASMAEQQILILARQQAQREEELAQSQRHILALQEEIEELERENRLHGQQEAKLKEELRNMERSQKREGVDMTYLKNVIVKLLETGEVEALLPVVAMLLQFSPEEMHKCQQAYQSSTEVPPSPGSEASPTGLSLFSRFTFS